MVTAYRDGKYITRNISQFKVTDSSLKESDQEEDEDDDLSNDMDTSSVNPPVRLALPANPTKQLNRTRNSPQQYGIFIY